MNPAHPTLRLILFGALFVPSTTGSYAQTSVFVSPETSRVAVGESLTVAVTVGAVANLHGAHLVVTFDNAIICVDSVTQGPLMEGSGLPVFFSINPLPGPTTSSMVVDEAMLGLGSVSGSGVLFRMRFHAVGGGTSPVTLMTVDLRDPTNLPIPAVSFSGTVAVARSTVTVNMMQGWNMISNPVTVSNDSVRQLFPQSTFDYAFAFTPGAGYIQRYTMDNGVGYWEKFPTASGQTIIGTERTRDSLDVVAGWNMVGTISSPVDTGSIVSVPAGLRGSDWFGFGPSGYVAVPQLVPGNAYWVKSNGPGRFVLASPGAR